MSSPRQSDLFGHEGPDPSDEDFETPVYYPDPDKVREELHRILAEMRAAEAMMPSAPRSIAPSSRRQMAGCLPEEEGAQLRFQFEEELARLQAA